MPILNVNQVEATYGKRFQELLDLPGLTLDELRGGQTAIDELAARSDPLRSPLITMPSFENTVALVPDNFLPAEDRTAVKRQRIAQLRASPLPQSILSLSRIVSAIDNVQDALVTSSVLLRIASLAVPELRPIAIGAGAAADALAALNTVAAAPLAPLSGKFNWKTLARGSIGSQAVRAAKATNIATAMPTVGENLQIFQTTRDLFGVGLQLGPAMGFIGSTAYGVPANAQFVLPGARPFRPDDDFFSSPEAAASAISGTVDDLLGEVLRAPADLAELVGITQDIPWADHFGALVAANMGAEIGRALIHPANWQPIVTPRLHRADLNPPPKNPLTQRLLTEVGINWHQSPPRAIPGAASAPTVITTLPSIRDTANRTILPLLAEAPDDRLRGIASSLATDLPFRMVRAFEGASHPFEAHDAPHTRVITDTLELGLLPPTGSTVTQRASYLFDAARLYQDPRQRIPIRDLKEIFQKSYGTPPPIGS